LELRSWNPPFATIFVHCSSGTYIRSLARDIALAAGSRAHLTALVRTKVAGFELTASGELHPIDKRVFHALAIPCLEVSPEDAKKITQGKPLAQILKEKPAHVEEKSAAAIFSGDAFIAMVERHNNTWSYGYVWNT
jgi:tRNA pseudouridine55 synthase